MKKKKPTPENDSHIPGLINESYKNNDSVILPIIEIPSDGMYVIMVGNRKLRFILDVTNLSYSIFDLNDKNIIE